MLSEQVEHADGRVALLPGTVLDEGRLANEDLAPVALERRTWTTYNYAALWISMAHCIPTYMMASGLIRAGMSWRQALFTILLANVIVLVPILLNSHPGTRYGIPFPVFARAAYGVYGSNLPALMRALVACGWFGIQCWIGGKALHVLFSALWHPWGGLLGLHVNGYPGTQWVAFALFWGANLWIVYSGMDLLRKVENWAAPFVLVMTGALVAWVIYRAHGLGPILARGGNFRSSRAFLRVFAPSLTAMIGFWATLSLNMPDFTRYGRSQREQVLGQVVALPTTMTLFSAMGVIITSASTVIYGVDIWDPMELAEHFGSRVVVAVAMFTVVVATLAVNIAANVVSPANDFANAFPRWVTFRRGGLITGLLGVAMRPWKLLADPSGYIYTWLQGYSGGLASIAGVLIADYWLVKKRQLDLADLYRAGGRYAYGSRAGTNPVAIVATVVGCALAWVGLVVHPLRVLYDYAWFVGSLGSGAVYLVGMRAFGDRAAVGPHVARR